MARLYKIVNDSHGAHGALTRRWALANTSCEKSPWGFVSRTSWMSAICGPEPNRVKARVSADTLNERMRLRPGRPRSVMCGRPQVLTLHSDRGAPMKSKCTAQLLADLGVTRSLSRPQVSDDNPSSVAQFKTLKYHPGFPGRFHNITAAIAFCRTFFPWYNTEHRHGGIAVLTPDGVHPHSTESVLRQRRRTLQIAWARHPERFVRGIPKPDALSEAVWINPPVTSTTGETTQ